MDSRQTVLIIDPDPQSRGAIKGMVQALGYEVVAAWNARDGLARFDECPSQAVITHLGSPHLAGLQAAYHLKARCPQARVVVIVDEDFYGPAAELQRLGVDVLIQAPIRFSAIKRALARSQPRAPVSAPADPGRVHMAWTHG